MRPTGTVTFLFTDVEGSTRLARENREDWDAIQKRHHAILRQSIESCGGYVFQIVGDAFCAAFSTAGEAVRAAVKIQVALNEEPWLENAIVKVRAGLHTGTATIREDGEYQGYLAMSRAQRLLSAAHGGQVLLSLASQELVRDHFPEGVVLRDLGTHRLKDVPQPEHIYQLVIPGLEADFPSIKTLERTGSHPASRLTVRLIGTFEILLDGKPVNFAGRIAQSLFCYLVLHAGVPHRREKLAGMFWPDVTEAKARTYLRHEIWSIRKSLPSEDKQAFLITDDIAVTFNPSADYWLDVMALGNVKDSASTEDLMDALAHYRGDFLPGFYDEWITLEREHLQAVFEKRMARLLDLLENEQRWKEILEWAERWISLGQGPEAAYRALMIAYDGLGEPAKVASAFRRCLEALREQNLEPSEQTRALAFKRTSRLKIPVPLTSFIGREKELEEVAKMISESRLVTLTGSGGVGKTRLAIQVVADILEPFPDGVWFLDLAPVMDPAVVPNTLAGVLDLQLTGGRDLSYTDLIIGYLRSRRALIIFDNCEHLIEACAELAHSLLTSCEQLSILATSREPLRVSGEVPYRVPSLGIPELNIESLVESLRKTESVQLFTDRASVAATGFAIAPQNALIVAKICQRLDGIPLAIELAAARVHVLGVEQILHRLDDRFSLLTGGSRSALPRHQTLRATIEWSYDLLSEKERLFFQRLAAFVGGWTLEAAEEVCSGNGIKAAEVLSLLSKLVDKSLVQVEKDTSAVGSPRYRRLETIRQYASEKFIASSEVEQIRARHLEYFLKLAQNAELEQQSEKMIEWMQKLQDEHENMRTALKWSLEQNGNAGQKLAYALYWWWNRNGYWIEGYEWLQKMLSVSTESEALIKAKLLDATGWLAAHLNYNKQAIAFAEESLALFRKLGDKEGMATSLGTLATRAYNRSDFDQATALMEECCALYRDLGNKWRLIGPLSALGYTAEAQGKFEQAHKFYEECMFLSKEIGDQESIGWILYLMGNLAILRGNNSKAMKLYEESLRITKSVKQKPHIIWILNAMGSAAVGSGDYERGAVLLGEAIELCQEMGDQAGMAYSFHWLGWAALLQGDYAPSRTYYLQCLQLVQDSGDVLETAECLIGVGQLMAVQGAPEKFVRLVGVAEGTMQHFENRVNPFFLRETEKFVDSTRVAMGDDAYTRALEAGCQMNIHEGIAYALRELQ